MTPRRDVECWYLGGHMMRSLPVCGPGPESLDEESVPLTENRL